MAITPQTRLLRSNDQQFRATGTYSDGSTQTDSQHQLEFFSAASRDYQQLWK